MRVGHWMTGLGLGAICAAGIIASPALQAQERSRENATAPRSILAARAGMGNFTPAAADPKLAAILARGGMPNTGFRFTPAESRGGGGRAVTVAIRARSTRALQTASRLPGAATPAVNLAPIAYNLGVSVGWKRFAVSGDVTHVDLITQPGSRETAELGVSYSGKRVSGRLRANADRPLADTPILIGDKPSYSVDLGGSYSLTRNLDVTAGVRYKSERDRLPKITDDRRDSQAVYVGTAFRF